MQKYTNVDDYIASAPNEIQYRLKTLRDIILATIPQAKESMSYGMAYYSYKGKLLYFGYFKKHIGLFIPGSILKDFQEDLKKYETSTATIRFPLSEELPLSLIKKLVKARVASVEKEK
jgi:uncharacterized protein YdhG (YjbR/CyaY superfamily)